ncbi:MAG: hypothetical protein U0572_15100 [Phycisphaerales bacterium]
MAPGERLPPGARGASGFAGPAMRFLVSVAAWFAIVVQAFGLAARGGEDVDMLAGFARRLKGETIVYHSPDPEATAAMVVRSLDASRGIEWETEPAPAVIGDGGLDVVWMFALQVDPAAHRFTISVDGKPWFELRNPPTNAVRDWTLDGPRGATLRFRATMIDRFNDLMGYATLHLPRAALVPGTPLRIGVTGESAGSRAWYITFAAPVRESASVAVAPALLRGAAANERPIVLRVTHIGPPVEAVISTSFGVETKRTLELGGNRIDLRREEVQAPEDFDVRVTIDGRERHALRGRIEPMRPWSIDLVQHTHTDVGYTRPQTEILPEQCRFIDTALDYCDKTDGYPDDARFRWTCETSWAVREYLRTRTPEQIERLRRRAAEGRIEATGMLLNMSEVIDEASYPAFLEPVRLARAQGIPVTTAIQNDVNGVAWCLADLFGPAGVEYLVMGQHGHRALMPFDRPTCFWWESPAGARVLAFRADHYHTGNFWGVHTGSVEAVEDELLRYLAKLDRSGYPFDRIAVEHSGYPTDNAPPSTAASELVRGWNEKYVWPRLRCSTAREFLAWVKSSHANELPVVRGAWTDWWTDGFGSAARETAAARRAQARLGASEATLAMEALAGVATPAALRHDVDAAREALIFWGEHTLGSAESIREPLCENSQVQWLEKAAYAWDAVKRAASLDEAAMARLESLVRGGSTPRLVVVNTLNFARSGVVELYADHEMLPLDRPFRIVDERGAIVPAQRLKSRAEGTYWALWVADVPAFGWRTYRIEIDRDGRVSAHVPTRATTSIESASCRLALDAARGAIASLVDASNGAELVDASNPWGLGAVIHESLGNREQLEGFRLEDFARTGLRDVVVDGADDGPIWTSLRWHGALPGCEGADGVRCEARLFHVEPRVELSYAIQKRRVFEPEGIYVAFPFAMPEGRLRVETLGAIADPARDIIPGASSDWQAIQGFVAVRGAERQVVLTSPEIPLVQCGDINLGKFQRQTTVDRPHVYSWVMNNYWTTNFCASQEGEFRWSYAITASADASDASATREGWSRRVPFGARIVAGDGPDRPLDSRSLLACDAPNLLLVAARPNLRGDGVILHLREIDGRPARLDVRDWRIGGRDVTVREANALEVETGEPMQGVDFAPRAVKFLTVRPR